MALVLAYVPLRRRAGVKMLCCVAAFGAATVVFGLSRNLYLSMFALFVVGAADMVSVIVRSTAGAVGHSGRDARAGERREHAVHRRLE